MNGKIQSLIFSRIFLVFIFSILLSIAAIPIRAQVWDKDPTEAAVQGIINVTSSIISDSFTPMTHYDDGDWNVTLVPAYFKVSRVFDDPDLRGDDLKGWALGIGGGYALSDRWLLYGIFAAMRIEGEVYDRDYADFRVDTTYTLYSLNAGFGFDIIGGDSKWSIPLFFGISIERYSADIGVPPITGPPVTEVDVSGEGMIYGLSGGFAVSREFFGKFRITPYFLMLRSINQPELTANFTSLIISEEMDFKLDPVSASMLGLNITYVTDRSFSISISAGGYLSSSSGFYNDKFLDGLRMKSVVIAITYNGSAPRE
jgi:hypothetical protein